MAGHTATFLQKQIDIEGEGRRLFDLLRLMGIKFISILSC